MSYVEEAGDPYKEEMEQCIDLIMAELRRRDVDNPFKLAYQVRVSSPCFQKLVPFDGSKAAAECVHVHQLCE